MKKIVMIIVLGIPFSPLTYTCMPPVDPNRVGNNSSSESVYIIKPVESFSDELRRLTQTQGCEDLLKKEIPLKVSSSTKQQVIEHFLKDTFIDINSEEIKAIIKNYQLSVRDCKDLALQAKEKALERGNDAKVTLEDMKEVLKLMRKSTTE